MRYGWVDEAKDRFTVVEVGLISEDDELVPGESALLEGHLAELLKWVIAEAEAGEE